jgi:uncharacterized lipoprotein YajG
MRTHLIRRRSLPAVLAMLVLPALLSACASIQHKMDLAYQPMEKPVQVAGAPSVVIDLDVDGEPSAADDRFGHVANESGSKVTEWVATQGIIRMTYEAFQTELRARGFALGKGPVRVSIWVTAFRAEYTMGVLTFEGGATAGIVARVFGPGGKQYFQNAYWGEEKSSTALVLPNSTTRNDMQTAFAEAVHGAMADKELIAAILKAHAEAQSADAVAPVIRQARRVVGLGS